MGQFYREARRWYTWDANAAIEGALAGGATEIVVIDPHHQLNILWPELHPQAQLVRRDLISHTPLGSVEGLDESFDDSVVASESLDESLIASFVDLSLVASLDESLVDQALGDALDQAPSDEALVQARDRLCEFDEARDQALDEVPLVGLRSKTSLEVCKR